MMQLFYCWFYYYFCFLVSGFKKSGDARKIVGNVVDIEDIVKVGHKTKWELWFTIHLPLLSTPLHFSSPSSSSFMFLLLWSFALLLFWHGLQTEWCSWDFHRFPQFVVKSHPYVPDFHFLIKSGKPCRTCLRVYFYAPHLLFDDPFGEGGPMGLQCPVLS